MKRWLATTRRLTAGVLLLALFFPVGWASASAADANATKLDKDIFALVGNERISMQEFEAAFRTGIRKRFYHGKIPEEQIKAFRKEVSQTIVDRLLLLQAAKKRGISPDKALLEKELEAYRQRYAGSRGWSEHQDTLMSGLKSALEEQNILQQFEDTIKNIELPNRQEAEQYYQAHPDLFTTPEQLHLSLILLKVAPSSSPEVWEAAQQEANEIHRRIKKGADFSQLARIHSGDGSAAKGGDMGFVHKGMLSPAAQRVVDTLKNDQVSEPLTMLRGVALFKLIERKSAELNPFDVVAERAVKLLARERAQRAWTDLKENLRSSVKVSINSAAL